MEYKANFDWDITKRKLVIFLPSFKYPELTEFSISQIQTKVDPSEWIIIIGNDNVDINWDHLKYRNVRYFTLLREDSKPRNSCYIRNFAIKRTKSEFFLQKDAEVVVLGDFIHNVINSQKPWRAGKIYFLDEKQTELYLKTADIESTIEKYPTKFYSNSHLEVNSNLTYANAAALNSLPYSNFIVIDRMLDHGVSSYMKNIITQANGNLNPSSYFHYAFGIETKVLQEIRGYDEDYSVYGWNDSDMFCRLYSLGKFITPDYSCTAIHLHHKKVKDIVEDQAPPEMRKTFIMKDPMETQRNPTGWGEGKKERKNEILDRPSGYQYLNILNDHLGGDLGKIFKRELIYPRQIEIHLPADHIKPCNFNCFYCQGKLLERPVDVYFEEDALKLIKQLDNKIDYYIYGGAYSEPLMNPYLFEFLKTSKECGAKFGIHTNGSLLLQLQEEQDFLTKLCNIATLREDYLSISLDAGSVESHKKTKNTSKPWFNTIIKGIRKAVEIRGNKTYPAIRVCYLLNKYNSSHEELKNIITIMKDIEVDSLKFSIPYDLYGKSFDKVRKYRSQIEIPKNKQYKEELLKLLSGEKGIRPKIFYISPDSQNVDDMKFKQCIYSYYQITLGADGYVYKCSSTASPSFKMNRLGKITSDIKEFNKMVLANHNPKFNPCICFKVGARCNRMALEVNKTWENLHNV